MNKIRIKNTNQFIIPNNIYCIGKNYVDHIKELGGSKIPKKPVIFFKPNTSIVTGEPEIIIPEIHGRPISESLHYEAELAVIISGTCYKIKENEADNYIKGYAIGLDMTLRDIQSEAKANGLPWATAKGFYTSAPISEIILKEKISDPMNINLKLEINGALKQFSNTSLMIFNIYKLISYISNIFYLKENDIIYTGTPSGVGEVKSGDKLRASLDNYITLNARVQ